MSLNMYALNDIQQLSKPKQLLKFAESYLQAAEILCGSFCENSTQRDYADGAVIMSLTFHAEELFFKTAIILKDKNFSFGKEGHNLPWLNQKYIEMYPEDKYRFNLLFNRSIPSIQSLVDEYKIDISNATELIKNIKNLDSKLPEDQLHRYPHDKSGEDWRAVIGFEPNSFLTSIQVLKLNLARLKKILCGKNGMS